MRPLLRLVLGVVALFAILAAVAVTLPQQVHVARSVVINAPEGAIFPYLNDLHKTAVWLPWAQRDRDLSVGYSGAEKGEGAHVEWYSEEPSIGAGSMDITKSEAPQRVDYNVDYGGLEGTSYLLVTPSGSGSKVTWGFGYEPGNNLFKRWKGLMLDRLVGTDYQAGLAALKHIVERERAPEDSVTPTPAAPPPAAPAEAAPAEQDVPKQ
ncbi:Polyketide cyclase / dehydrase and lipid transport [Methyloligella halotolerans]|uniref:Polyketide cyclase / dehydrase and lipid transport n=1 Tax=Methyloligella halotolerans TaxID=1177755 RepID=A0A1E2RXM9_9HYPH|nr:Polyketide cyclase / dehydrase and lipid transport [Methyloligella halotolerans]